VAVPVNEDEVLAPHAHYLDGLQQRELRYQRCHDCGGSIFYPRILCHHCGSTRLEFARSTGLGTVYSTTAVTRREEPSYSICLVDLDEGFRMMSSVVTIRAEDVRIGMRVIADIEHVEANGNASRRVVFRPVAQ